MAFFSMHRAKRIASGATSSCVKRYKQLQASAGPTFKLDELRQLRSSKGRGLAADASAGPSLQSAAYLNELYMTDAGASLAHDDVAVSPTAGLEAECVTLKNGVRVVVDPSSAAFCAAGVLINAGTRDEMAEEEGSTLLLEKLALKKTERYSEAELQGKMHALGGAVQVASSRDSIFYSAAILPQHLEALFDLFGSMVLEPSFDDSAMKEASQKLVFDLIQMRERPDELLNELAHVQMFGGRGLGASALLSDRASGLMLGPEAMWTAGGEPTTASEPVSSREGVLAFHKRVFRPENIIVGAVGIPMHELVAVAEKTFGHLQPSPCLVLPTKHKPALPSYSPYVGGPLCIEDGRLATSWLGLPEANPYPDHVHFLLAFPSCPAWHRDIYPMAVLHSLLGGGSSFSSGGPGKGIYSRLYTRLLNRYGYIESAHSVQANYRDAGFFGIAVNCAAPSLQAVLSIVIRELFAMADFQSSGLPPSPRRFLSSPLSTLEHTKFDAQVEFQRAKNQVKSQLLMAMESRLAQLENLLKDMSIVSRPMSRQQLLEGVDKVSFDDLKQVRRRLLNGRVLPTLVAVGPSLAALPTFSQLLEMVEEQRVIYLNKH